MQTNAVGRFIRTTAQTAYSYQLLRLGFSAQQARPLGTLRTAAYFLKGLAYYAQDALRSNKPLTTPGLAPALTTASFITTSSKKRISPGDLISAQMMFSTERRAGESARPNVSKIARWIIDQTRGSDNSFKPKKLLNRFNHDNPGQSRLDEETFQKAVALLLNEKRIEVDKRGRISFYKQAAAISQASFILNSELDRADNLHEVVEIFEAATRGLFRNRDLYLRDGKTGETLIVLGNREQSTYRDWRTVEPKGVFAQLFESESENVSYFEDIKKVTGADGPIFPHNLQRYEHDFVDPKEMLIACRPIPNDSNGAVFLRLSEWLPRPHFGGGLSEPARQLYSANLEDKTVVNVEISGLLLKVAKKIELILKSPNNVGKSLKEIWEIEEAKYVNQQRPIIKPGGLSGLLDTEAEKKFWAQCAPLMHVFLKSWDHQQMAKMCLNSLHLESGNVIGDFASGVGNFMAQAIPFIVTDRKLNNVQLHGVDFTPAMIEEARKNPLFAEYGVKLHLADLCGQLPFEDNFFDGIAMVLGFGYLANPDQALTNMLRVLKPGGLATFITTVPKFNSFALFWRNVWRSSLFKVLKDIPMGWRYVKYMRAINRKLQEGVYRGYWNETLAEAISQAGFTDVIPLGLNSGSGRYFSGVTARKPISTTPA